MTNATTVRPTAEDSSHHGDRTATLSAAARLRFGRLPSATSPVVQFFRCCYFSRETPLGGKESLAEAWRRRSGSQKSLKIMVFSDF